MEGKTSILTIEQMINTSKIDCIINNSEDLKILKKFLQIKIHYAQQVSFSFKKILDTDLSSNVEDVCQVLKCGLVVQADETENLFLFQYIYMNLSGSSNDNLLITLKLFNEVLMYCEKTGSETVFNEYLKQKKLDFKLCLNLQSPCVEVVNFLITRILPKYIRMLNTSADVEILLEKCWEIVAKTQNLSILCGLLPFFIPKTLTYVGFMVTRVEQFWSLLQANISSKIITTQKYACYILKVAINWAREQDQFEMASKVVAFSSNDLEDISVAWKNYFILLEVAREKQLHLIQPAYHLLDSVQILHSSWRICLYKILLSHPQSAVNNRVVVSALNGMWMKDVNVFKQMIPLVLGSLNKNEFSKDFQESWKCFENFSKVLDDDNKLYVIQESLKIVWLPAAIYRLYRAPNILSGVKFPFKVIEDIINICENLPHKYIRKGCMEHIGKFVGTQIFSNKMLSLDEQIKLCIKGFVEEKQTYEDFYVKYKTELDNKLLQWQHSFYVNIYEVELTRKLMQFEIIGITLIEELVMLGQCSSEISDKLLLSSLDRKDTNCKFLAKYIEQRLDNLKIVEDLQILVKMVSCLPLKEEYQIQCSLLKKSTEVLFSQNNFNIKQKQFAFCVYVTTNRTNYSLTDKDIADVCNVWENILDPYCNKIDDSVCICFLELFCQSSKLPQNTLVKLVKIYDSMFETQNYQVHCKIFFNMRFLIDDCGDSVFILDVTDNYLKQLLELRKSDAFLCALKHFLDGILWNNKICDSENNIRHKCTEVAQQLLNTSKSCSDIAAVYMAVYEQFEICNADVPLFLPFVTQLLIDGDVLRTDQRFEYDVCLMIMESGICTENETDVCPSLQRSRIRMKAATMLKNLLNNLKVAECKKVADDMTVSLINQYRIHFNKRYFANSQIHMEKFRILQALLIIHNHISTQIPQLIELLISSLCEESHQISVKYLIQWLLVQLLLDDDRCFESISSAIESTSKMHSSTIIAFIPILYHIAVWKKDEQFLKKVFVVMLPWTMGAHFNLRLYSQTALVKLYEKFSTTLSKSISKYKPIISSITAVLEKTERKIDPIDEHFFDEFDPTEQHDLETIYIEVPKRTNIAVDEYETFSFHLNRSKNNDFIDTLNALNANSPSKACSKNTVIQKKIMPWNNPFEEVQPQNTAGELVVVASLIEKAPNLGGLVRTCEIFGVKQLAVNTGLVVKNEEFKSLSMSSENWVNIVEVKETDLIKYLLHMKENGYHVVAGEQTSESVKLNEFKFPKKSVLLLGNERLGIPANLFPVIDTCVEIPQFGVVRSLNVHVAASTFVWEYSKQYLI